MGKRIGNTRLVNGEGLVQVKSINMEMFRHDVSSHPRDREYESRIGGEINIELWANAKIVDFSIDSKPIASELYSYSTQCVLDIQALPPELVKRMHEVFLDTELYLSQAIIRDVHERN